MNTMISWRLWKNERRKEEIQCTIARKGLLKHPAFLLGKPSILSWDYADGVDTMDFLLGI